LAVLVLVAREKFAGIDQTDHSQRGIFHRYADGARIIARAFGFAPLMPDIQEVTSRRDIWNGKLAGPVCDCVVRRVHDDDCSAHLGMDIAEDVANSGSIERHAMRRTGFIQAEIESLPVEHRKYIVKERVEIRKFDNRSDGNYQHVWIET